MRIQKNLNDLTERYEPDDDDESDKHLEARDRRYSCLTCLSVNERWRNIRILAKNGLQLWQFLVDFLIAF